MNSAHLFFDGLSKISPNRLLLVASLIVLACEATSLSSCLSTRFVLCTDTNQLVDRLNG